MAIPARLSHSLHDLLGAENADDLVNWMVLMESGRSELREVMEAWRVATDARFAEFSARTDTRFAEAAARTDARFAEAAARTDARFAEAAARTDARFAEMNSKMDLRFAEQQRWMEARFAEQRDDMKSLELRFERRFGDLLKWSFVFWCGAVGAVAMLARAFR